jgi:transcriptional regulator with XRE-family HTH domain
MDPSVGQVLKACRQQRNLSARELSARAGLSPSVAGKVENGTIVPSLRVFARLVRALDLHAQEVSVLVTLAALENVDD